MQILCLYNLTCTCRVPGSIGPSSQSRSDSGHCLGSVGDKSHCSQGNHPHGCTGPEIINVLWYFVINCVIVCMLIITVILELECIFVSLLLIFDNLNNVFIAVMMVSQCQRTRSHSSEMLWIANIKEYYNKTTKYVTLSSSKSYGSLTNSHPMFQYFLDNIWPNQPLFINSESLVAPAW